MRYQLDVNGYVLAVFWGCYSGNCAEYTGEVPVGYPDLITWSEDALINAYYINSEGNLTLDYERQAELELKTMIETIDNTPVLTKDLVGSNEILDSQYVKEVAIGNVVKLTNVQSITPRVILNDIKCYRYSSLNVYSQGYNMLRNDGQSETINGVDFTVLPDGSIRINGTATADIEYNLSGSSTNASPIFVLKNNNDYYLNLNGYSCEMKYFDGETTSQVYTGNDGVINLSEDKKVTQVLLKIPAGTVIESVLIYPMLNYGTEAEPYEAYKSKVLSIDFSKYIDEGLLPSDDLFPSDDLYPYGTIIDYILIENGLVYVSKNGVERTLSAGNVQLFNGNNTVYVDEDANVLIEYSINVLAAEDRINARIERTEEEINLKVGNDEIISSINLSKEKAAIKADKIDINGTVSANGNFKVDTEGNMSCNNANITGGKIELESDSAVSPKFLVKGNGIGNFESVARMFPDTFQISTEKTFICGIGIGTDVNKQPYGYGNFESVSGSRSTIDAFEISTPILYQTSLESQKKNFEKLQCGLDIIKGIDIYKYNLKHEKDTDKKHIGFVIGDDYNYSEEVTSLDNKGVDNYSFISLCCKAIQEQQEIIEQLQKEIKELKEVK